MYADATKNIAGKKRNHGTGRTCSLIYWQRLLLSVVLAAESNRKRGDEEGISERLTAGGYYQSQNYRNYNYPIGSTTTFQIEQ
jgi:hypothetical protein